MCWAPSNSLWFQSYGWLSRNSPHIALIFCGLTYCIMYCTALSCPAKCLHLSLLQNRLFQLLASLPQTMGTPAKIITLAVVMLCWWVCLQTAVVCCCASRKLRAAAYFVLLDGSNGCRVAFASREHVVGPQGCYLDGVVVRMIEVYTPDHPNRFCRALYHRNRGYGIADFVDDAENQF